jgi:hypothetical protein
LTKRGRYAAGPLAARPISCSGGTYLIRAVDINVAALAKRFNKADDKLTLAVGAFDADYESPSVSRDEERPVSC